MECNCKGWKKSANQIFSVQAIVALTKGMHYTGDTFKFCPWCGKNLASQHRNSADGENLTKSEALDRMMDVEKSRFKNFSRR
jgi:hypothetical protein